VDYSRFQVPSCIKCDGLYKPTVVFFGENVPKEKVDFTMAVVRESDKMLVVGTSLQVYSSFRFVRAAADHRIPIALLNIGPTRADDFAELRVEARAGEFLQQVQLAISNDAQFNENVARVLK